MKVQPNGHCMQRNNSEAEAAAVLQLPKVYFL